MTKKVFSLNVPPMTPEERPSSDDPAIIMMRARVELRKQERAARLAKLHRKENQ